MPNGSSRCARSRDAVNSTLRDGLADRRQVWLVESARTSDELRQLRILVGEYGNRALVKLAIGQHAVGGSDGLHERVSERTVKCAIDERVRRRLIVAASGNQYFRKAFVRDVAGRNCSCQI